MPDLIGNGLRWLDTQRHEHLTRPVSYYRQGTGSLTLSATPGQTETETLDGEGFPVTARLVDWIVRREDLVLEGRGIEPRRGDRIVTGERTFEVLPVGDEGCYRLTDPEGMTLRVHTKEVTS